MHDTENPELEVLFEATYQELRKIAGRLFTREAHRVTLQPTALVNEVYVKLSRQPNLEIRSRSHFLALSARVMRRVLIEYARHRGYKKRGSGKVRVTLTEGSSMIEPEAVELLDLTQALEKLERVDARKATTVQLRYFGGLSIDETAAVLGTSAATVNRDWRVARAFLFGELEAQTPASPRTPGAPISRVPAEGNSEDEGRRREDGGDRPEPRRGNGIAS